MPIPIGWLDGREGLSAYTQQDTHKSFYSREDRGLITSEFSD